MDFGSIGGPTDGTSSVSRMIDANFGNQPGLIFIPGTGDNGGEANHAAASVPQGGSVTVKVYAAGPLDFDLWYANTDAFDVAIQTPDTTYGPFTAPAGNACDDQTNLAELAYYACGPDVVGNMGPMDGKRDIFVRLNTNSPIGEYSITLTGRTVANGHFDATINSFSNSFFENLIVPGSISDFGSTRNAVTDTCYVIRTSWTDIDGIPRALVGQGTVGGIWLDTSVGPTFDGRRGIDISAPAEQIVTAYDPKSYWATFRFNEINDGNGLYGTAGANSSSNPVTAGVIALMLQMDPKLDSFTVKDILHKSARADSSTGSVPNPTWGHGKIDALNALDLMANTPKPVIGSIVNGASFAAGAVAPGEIFTIFGSSLGPSTLAPHDDLSWDQRFIGAVNGTEVLFDGVPASMIYTSSGQIAGVVPYAVAGRTTSSVQVLYEGVASAAQLVTITASSPAIFLAPSLGPGASCRTQSGWILQFAVHSGVTRPRFGSLRYGRGTEQPKRVRLQIPRHFPNRFCRYRR